MRGRIIAGSTAGSSSGRESWPPRGASDICADPSVRPRPAAQRSRPRAGAVPRGPLCAGPGERPRGGHLSTVRRDCPGHRRPVAGGRPAQRGPADPAAATMPGQPGRRYSDAARLLRDWQDEGILVPDPEPALYVYEQAACAGGAGPAARADRRAAAGAARAGLVLPHEDVDARAGGRAAPADGGDRRPTWSRSSCSTTATARTGPPPRLVAAGGRGRAAAGAPWTPRTGSGTGCGR